MARRIMLAGLLKIELPGHIVLLAEGGRIAFGGDVYLPKDPLFGMIEAPDELDEGMGEEAPMATIRFVPPPEVASADLIKPEYQGSRLRVWLAELDADTGLIVGEPSLEVDAIVDVPRLSFDDDVRTLDVDWVSVWQRLFAVNEGNLLNDGAHQRVHPGELGLANTTGVTRTVAWGVKAPRGQG